MTQSGNDRRGVQLWTTEISAQGFFHEKVVEAQQRQNLKLTENVEFYLVNLLCEFVSLNGTSQGDCLALMLKKALESETGEQIMLFKRLGDTALYFGGFFQEYFNRKCFDVGYYISMGEGAYSQLSSLMRRKQTANVALMYEEMSKNFSRAIDIMMDVSEHTSNQDHIRDTLSVYDAWLNSASEKLERDLRKRGIMPVKAKGRLVQ